MPPFIISSKPLLHVSRLLSGCFRRKSESDLLLYLNQEQKSKKFLCIVIFLNGCSQTLEALFECQYILGIMCWKFKFLIILSYSEDAQHRAIGIFYWGFFFFFLVRQTWQWIAYLVTQTNHILDSCWTWWLYFPVNTGYRVVSSLQFTDL